MGNSSSPKRSCLVFIALTMDDDQENSNNPSSTDDQNGDDQDLIDPDGKKHQKAKPPSVTGEEDAFSGDMPAESPDIDEELGKVGLSGDEEGPKPLGVTNELDEDEKAKEEEAT